MSAKVVATAIIEKFSHDGRGLARIEGKTTFIEGALPDETVTYHILRKKRAFDEGNVLDVVVPSMQRVVPRCVHYGVCGGCSLQHLNEHAQIHEKEALLLDTLLRIGRVTPETVLPPLVSEAWHYRDKARLSVCYVESSKTVSLGFREKHRPRLITDVTSCAILNDAVPLDALRTLILALDHPQTIAQLEVAVGDEGVAVILRHLAPLSLSDQTLLRACAMEHNIKLFLQSKGPNSIYLFYPEAGDGFLTYRLPAQGITFKFHPTDFTQVNSSINKKMVALALELLALKPDDKVLDLFCGLGNFALPIAKHCESVMGVEGTAAMVERAKMNARDNQLTNTTFLARNLEDSSVLLELQSYGANKLLIDPPRAGAHAFVKGIDALNLDRIVYVSCNPATFARDLGILVHEKGYRLCAVGVMDMFPHTAHVESIALLEKI